MEKKTRRQKKAEYQKTYRQRYPKKIAASNKSYYEKNKESLGEKRKGYRADNPAKESLQKDIIREHRRSLGLSQQKYAQALGVTHATVSNWERGIVPVNVETVEAAFPGMAKKLKQED